MDSIVSRGLELMKPGSTRISMGYDWSDADVDFVADALELLATIGRDLLLDYDADVATGNYTSRRRTGVTKRIASLDEFQPFGEGAESDTSAEPQALPPVPERSALFAIARQAAERARAEKVGCRPRSLILCRPLGASAAALDGGSRICLSFDVSPTPADAVRAR